MIHTPTLVIQKMDTDAAAKWGEKAWETRKKNGESDPEVDRRLRFFGIDPDDL